MAQGDPREPLVLIVGHPRSGTTLLAEQLARIGVSVGEESHCLSAPRLRRWARARRRAPLVEMLAGDRRLRAYLDCAPDIDETRIRSPETLLWELSTAYRKKRGAARAGEKTPDHWLAVEDLLSSSPGPVQVLWCIRDIRDVVDSMRRVPWAIVGPVVVAHRWKHQVRIAMRLARKHPDRVRIHIHEDFLSAPDATLAAHAQWLGLAGPHPVRPDAGRGQQAQSFQDWERAWKADATRPPDPSKRFAWTTVPQSGTLFWDIACLTWNELDRLGYPLPPVRPGARHRAAAVVSGHLAHRAAKIMAKTRAPWESRGR